MEAKAAHYSTVGWTLEEGHLNSVLWENLMMQWSEKKEGNSRL
jgi:hypothetical protein